MRILQNLFLTLLATVLPALTWAQTETAHWGGFPTPLSSVAEETTILYNIIFWIITVIFAIVVGGMVWIMLRYRASVNPTPATFSHNTLVEVVWTVIPAIICVFIAWKSFETMVYVRTVPEKGITVEVVAYQFGWDFYYPDFAEGATNVAAAEPTVAHEQLSSAGVERLVKEMVVPVNTNIKLHVTASDVIHAFYAPDMGVKIDAMPGRINYAWFNPDREGEYIGQCAELCGSAHGEMFFTVKVVSKEEFADYINAQRVDAGLAPLPPLKVMMLVNGEAEAAPTDQLAAQG